MATRTEKGQKLSQVRVSKYLAEFMQAGHRCEARRRACLGHASIVTTQRYARLIDSAVKAEAERVRRRGVEDRVEDGLESARGELGKSAEMQKLAP
jgi:hypothetical protein